MHRVDECNRKSSRILSFLTVRNNAWIITVAVIAHRVRYLLDGIIESDRNDNNLYLLRRRDEHIDDSISHISHSIILSRVTVNFYHLFIDCAIQDVIITALVHRVIAPFSGYKTNRSYTDPATGLCNFANNYFNCVHFFRRSVSTFKLSIYKAIVS